MDFDPPPRFGLAYNIDISKPSPVMGLDAVWIYGGVGYIGWNKEVHMKSNDDYGGSRRRVPGAPGEADGTMLTLVADSGDV